MSLSHHDKDLKKKIFCRENRKTRIFPLAWLIKTFSIVGSLQIFMWALQLIIGNGLYIFRIVLKCGDVSFLREL